MHVIECYQLNSVLLSLFCDWEGMGPWNLEWTHLVWYSPRFSESPFHKWMGRRAASALASFMRQPITSGFPGDSVVKNLPVNAGDTGSIPGLGRSSREGNGNPLQCSHGGNPMDRGAWWVTVQGSQKSRTWLNDWTITTATSAHIPLARSRCLSVAEAGNCGRWWEWAVYTTLNGPLVTHWR